MVLNERSHIRPAATADPWLFVAGGLCGSIAALTLGTPMYFLVVGAITAFVVVAIDFSSVWRLLPRRTVTVVRVLLPVVVALSVTWISRPSKPAVFTKLFAVPPPAGFEFDATLRSVGPGDVIGLVRFSADADTLQTLMAHKGFAEDNQWQDDFRSGSVDWPMSLRRAIGYAYEIGGDEWKNIAPMSRPRVFRSPADAKAQGERTALLWDESSGRAYGRYDNR